MGRRLQKTLQRKRMKAFSLSSTCRISHKDLQLEQLPSLLGSKGNNLFLFCFLTTKLITIVNYRYLSRRASETNRCHWFELCEVSFNFMSQENTVFILKKKNEFLIPNTASHAVSLVLISIMFVEK